MREVSLRARLSARARPFDSDAVMRIMHIIPSADPNDGGPIEAAVRMGDVWRASGHIQHLVTLDDPAAPFVADCRSPVIALGKATASFGRFKRLIPWYRFGYTPGAAGWIRDHAADYDVIVVSTLWNYATMAARRGLRDTKTPYFVFTHGMLDPWFEKQYPLKHKLKQLFWRVNEGVLLRGARKVLFTTDEERMLARGSFEPYFVNEHVVNYGTADVVEDIPAQATAFRAAVPQVAGHKFLLFMSRIHPKKGCDLLIDAYAKLLGDDPAWKLVIAGPDQVGWIKTLKRQAEARGIADRIVWPGMLKGDAKWGAYRLCEAMILPSHQENFGIVVPEALACGKLVMITDKVNLWREIVEDRTGFVANDDAAGVESLIARFLALGVGERAAMEQRARASFLARFRIERTARQLLDVFGAAQDDRVAA